MDMRVFWAVLAALLIFGGVVVGWRALERQRDIEDLQAVMQSISDFTTNAVNQSEAEQAADHARRVRVTVAEWRSRRLLGNQRCVGGSVVQVDGATYTQLGSISNPVHCSGSYSDRPIR